MVSVSFAKLTMTSTVKSADVALWWRLDKIRSDKIYCPLGEFLDSGTH